MQRAEPLINPICFSIKKMKLFTTYIAIALISPLLIGCAWMGENYIGSVPKGSKKTLLVGVTGNKIKFPEISINFKPRNEILTSGYGFLGIIPVFIFLKDQKIYEGVPFIISISLKPSVEGITFDPKKIILELDGKEYSIVGITGHITTRSDIPEETVALHIKQGGVVCSKSSFIYFEKELPKQSIKLNGIEQWHCYDMIFNTKTPSPKQNFSLKIYGISHYGKSIEVKKIDFIKAKWSEYSS